MIFASVRDAAGQIVDFRWMYANPAAAQIVGRPRGGLIGRLLLEEMPGNRSSKLFAAYVRVAETGEPYTQELTYQHEGLDIDVRLVAVKAGDGFAVSFADLTPQRKAEAERDHLSAQRERAEQRLRESEERFRTLVESARDHAIIGMDLDGRVTNWNAGAERLLGWLQAEILGRPGELIFTPEDRAKRAPERELGTALEAGHASNERWHMRKDGTRFWGSGVVTPLRDDSDTITGFVKVFQDRTRERLASEALRESEERYRTLLERIEQGFCIIQMIYDRAGTAVDFRVLAVNPMFERHTGLGDALGKTARELVPGLEQDWVEIFHGVALSGEPLTFERESPAMGRWFAVQAVRVGASDDRRLALLLSDITVQRQIEADARLLAEVGERIRLADSEGAVADTVVQLVGRHFAASRCYLTEIDQANDRITIAHEYAEAAPPVAGSYRLSDYPPGVLQLLRQGQVLAVVDAETEPRDAALFATAYAPFGLRARITVPLLREGRWVATLVVAAAQPRAWQQREIRLLETVAERTWNAVERLRAAAALRASEARLQELYAQEQAARAEAEEASRLKDEFLTIVSHELRTPLTAFLGYAQLLRARPRDEAYIARTVEKMVASAKAQAHIIDDLLDVSRMITGGLNLAAEPVDLGVVARAALDTVRPAIEAKSLRVQLALDPRTARVVGDTGRLQQILWNLLSNAVKFTPPGGTIAVTLERDGGDARLTVRDSGEGIPAGFLPFVFDRFRQAEGASTRSHGGLGLGLAIVRHLVELHGGTVVAESAGVGQGATFVVRLPLAPGAASEGGDEQQPAAEEHERYPELEGLRVLVVDDQPTILELLDDILTPYGVQVERCESAEEGLVKLQAWRPHLLISDIAMPGQDGYWLLRAVRALPAERGGRTRAIALTAYGGGAERERALTAGFEQYVAKPISPDALLAVVANIAGRRNDPLERRGTG